jgi:hypothetical protein
VTFRPAPGLTDVPMQPLVTLRPETAIPLVVTARDYATGAMFRSLAT